MAAAFDGPELADKVHSNLTLKPVTNLKHRYVLHTLFLLAAFFASQSSGHAKIKWYEAKTSAFTAYSNTSKKDVEKTLEQLTDAKLILETLMPQLIRHQEPPLRVLICRGSGTMKSVAPLYGGKAKNLAGFMTKDYEGPILAIRSDYDDELNRHVIFHEYIHYLTRNSGRYLPPWLSEGIAELFASAKRYSKEQVIVGDSLKYNLAIIEQRGLIPFERLFAITRNSPEYNSSKHGSHTFYAQSWAFLHYLMFSEADLPPNAYQTFLARAFNGVPIDEAFVEETLNMNLKQLGSRVRNYCIGGKFSRHIYPLTSQSKSLTVNLRQMSEAEIQLMTGMVLLSTRGTSEAYAKLAHAAKALPQNPLAAAYLGYHSLRQEQFDSAAESLSRALQLGSESPYTHLNYARLLLREKVGDNGWRSDSLDTENTAKILTLLFKAKSIGGDFHEGIYQRIGETWLSSQITPEQKHIAVLVEGIRKFPTDKWIALCAATLYAKIENYDDALKIIFHYNRAPISSKLRKQFESLQNSIEEHVPDEKPE